MRAKSLVSRYPFWSFYVLAVAIACGVVLLRAFQDPSFDYGSTLFATIVEKGFHKSTVNIVSITAVTLDYSIYFGIFVFAGAPAIAALVVTAMAYGRKGLKELGGRFRPWREGVPAREAIGLYAVIILGYLVVMGLFALVTLYAGGRDALSEVIGGVGTSVIPFVILFLAGAFLEEGGTLEELGWRGFALPHLLGRGLNPLKASLVIAVMWLIWHLPREVPTLIAGTDLGAFFLGQFMFFGALVALSVIITYFFNRLGGSVIPAIMIYGLFIHCSRTLNWEAVSAMLPWPIDLRVPVFLVIALVVIWVAGRNLGLRDQSSSVLTTEKGIEQ